MEGDELDPSRPNLLPAEPLLPTLPPRPAEPPLHPPPVPVRPHEHPSPAVTPHPEQAGTVTPSDRPNPRSGEQLATRNVPAPPASPPDAAAAPGSAEAAIETPPLPELEPMGPSVVALLSARVLIAVAALLVGLAARRSTGVGGAHASAFWSVAASAAVLTFVGVAGLAYWSATLAGNARRLRTRSSSATAMAWSWAIPVGWVVLSSATYLRIDVDAEIDPLPGVAAVGWLIAVTIPYGRLQGVCRSLSRTPPIVWISAYPIDLIAFGLLWWRLTSWPSPVGAESDHVRLTAEIALWSSAALAVNVLVFVWLAHRTTSGVYERLGRLEALRRSSEEEPEWFQAGLAARRALAPPVVVRPLIATKHLGTTVSALHVLWGLASVVFGVALTVVWFRDDAAVFEGDELVAADADVDLAVAIGAVVAVLYVVAIVAHGIWATLTAFNARRVSVHSPNPGTFVLAFSPAPILLIAGLVVGGRAGYWLAIAGLTVGFAALILVNQMLLALSGRMGRHLHGFSRWTICLVLTYVAGFVINLLFARSAPQLGVYAMLSVAQGVLIAIGGAIGFSAMRDLDTEVRQHRQVHRVGT